jgi:IS30 family transposase
MQKRITYYERQIIEVGVRKGWTSRAIARFLRRDHRVIAREVERNTGDYLPYTAASAQRIADRHERTRTRKKLEKEPHLKAYVIGQLEQDHSPEQIAGRLRKHPPAHLRGLKLCHESIYQYIYDGEGRYEYLYPHLRRKQPRRRKQRARKPRKTLISERISIHERSAEVAKRKTYGHWESDTMLCTRQREVASVQYERKSQLMRLHKVNNKSAPETGRAIRDTIASLPQYLFKTMTFDNGGEGACHTKIRDDYMLQTYFCDAYASWQKGGVENMNGLLRQYIPKDANLTEMTDEDIYAIQEKLNNRPRKGLNYLTPNEVIASEVGH